MTEKRKLKKKEQPVEPLEEVKPSKLEYAVANYMKSKVPTKTTKFLSHPVNYFNASKAVDVLLDSPWATGDDAVFGDRESVVLFCNKLLQHKFFHRAKKIPITDRDLKPKELKKKKEKESVAKKKAVKKKQESEEAKTGDEAEKEEEKKKKKTKIKLDMHLDQVFVDGSEAYVWMYDPIPFWYYIAGGLCLFAAIAICLFPLWPPAVRKGVYYLSIAAAGFLGVIFGLAIVRFIIFVIIWALSLGRHHFWILPNLTEDVGFFASFWPLYHYEYRGSLSSKKKSGKKKKDKEEEKEECDTEKVRGEDGADNPSAAEDTDKPETDADRADDHTAASETESENSNSQTFEMVEKTELNTETEEPEE